MEDGDSDEDEGEGEEAHSTTRVQDATRKKLDLLKGPG